MIGVGEFGAYWSVVPEIGANFGAPSYTASNEGPPESGTVAVCGIEFAITASRACCVPLTEASTTPAGDAGGICAKYAGNELLATNVHGPSSFALRYQRPARSA